MMDDRCDLELVETIVLSTYLRKDKKGGLHNPPFFLMKDKGD